MGKGRERRSIGSRGETTHNPINKYPRTWTKPVAASSCALSGQTPAPLAPSPCCGAWVWEGGREGEEVSKIILRPDLLPPHAFAKPKVLAMLP